MEDINEILQDESLNDKLLTKELSIYIRNHRDKKKSIDGKFVSDIVSIIQSNDPELNVGALGLFQFIEGSLGCFCPYLDELDINDVLFIEMNPISEYLTKYKKEFETADNRLTSYFLYLSVIIHEMTHNKQYKNIGQKKGEVYRSSTELVSYHNSSYNDIHDYVPMERFANLRAYNLAYDVLSYIYKENDLAFFKRKIFDTLLDGYCVDENINQSPYSIFKTYVDMYDLTEYDIDTSKYKSLKSRLYLGLPISKEEFDFLVDTYLNMDYEKVSIRKLSL